MAHKDRRHQITRNSGLIWNIAHLRRLLREYETFYNTHRPHRGLDQAAPLRPLPDTVIDLDTFRVHRQDRAGGLLHNTCRSHRFSAPSGHGGSW